MPEIGDKIQFKPEAFMGEERDHETLRWIQLPRVVTGTIVYINRPHRFYDAEYEIHGVKLREAFKF